jgi:exonuclease VII large subunit
MGAITGKTADDNGGDETMTVPSWVHPYVARLQVVEDYVVDPRRAQEEESKLKVQINSLLELTDTLAKKVDDQSFRLAQAEKALENAEILNNLSQRIDNTSSQLDALENEFNDLKIDLSAWKAEVELKEQELRDEVLSTTDKYRQHQENLKKEVDERLPLLLKRTQWSREEMQQLYNVAELPPHIEAKFLAVDVNGDGCIKEFLEDKARSRRRYKEE